MKRKVARLDRILVDILKLTVHHLNRRFYAQDFKSLHAAISFLNDHLYFCPVCNRTLPEITQDVRMQRNVGPTFVGHDEPKSFGRVEPFDRAQDLAACSCLCHFSVAVSVAPFPPLGMGQNGHRFQVKYFP